MKKSPKVTVRSANESDTADREAIRTLLAESNLPGPSEDDTLVSFIVAERGGEIVGCAGWELHGGKGLLRSVVVKTDYRKMGVGRLLVEHALEVLKGLGVEDISLVTLDASGFFALLGFHTIDKGAVTGPVRSSPEYTLDCCESGTWMRRREE